MESYTPTKYALEGAEVVLSSLETQAIEDWSFHNFNSHASGHARTPLRDGEEIHARAGWNSEAPHNNCEKHVVCGRASMACITYERSWWETEMTYRQEFGKWREIEVEVHRYEPIKRTEAIRLMAQVIEENIPA